MFQTSYIWSTSPKVFQTLRLVLLVCTMTSDLKRVEGNTVMFSTLILLRETVLLLNLQGVGGVIEQNQAEGEAG